MIKFGNAALALVLIAHFASGSSRVECERFTTKVFTRDRILICDCRTTTLIDSSSFEIANTRSDVGALVFNWNKKIKFLPNKVSRSFINLEIYSAPSCDIKKITKNNFAGLRKLSILILKGNNIETIRNDVFEDLTSLKMLSLESNQIFQVNRRAFDAIRTLTFLDLRNNSCVQSSFKQGESSLSTLLEEVSSRCNIDESKNVLNTNCGRVVLSSTPVGFVVNGVKTYRGQYPFLVALNNIHRDIFFCGGNLISISHVVTAAHCIHQKDSLFELKAKEVSVLVGRYDLDKRKEEGGTTHLVSEIHVHPEWNPSNKKYDADIAILVLQAPVTFSAYIQPVCLPADLAIRDIYNGHVAGWGASEINIKESVQRHSAIKAVDDSTCYTTDPSLAQISSLRTFCAGAENAGPCSGDSGSGFFVKLRDRWMLKGLVSSSLLDQNFQCDVNRYTVYTKVSEYIPWIVSVCN